MQAIVHPDGRLVVGGLVFRAALGRGGVRSDKREGDGATPAGLLPLRRIFYRADRVRPPEAAPCRSSRSPRPMAGATIPPTMRLQPHGQAAARWAPRGAMAAGRLVRPGRGAGLERRAGPARPRIGDLSARGPRRLWANGRLHRTGPWRSAARCWRLGLTELMVLPPANEVRGSAHVHPAPSDMPARGAPARAPARAGSPRSRCRCRAGRRTTSRTA